MQVTDGMPMAPMRGKSAMAVGHQANAAVAAAQEAGAVIPKSAQGMAASAIARGIDPASLFDGQVEPDGDVAPPTGGGDDTGDPATDPTGGDTGPEPATNYATAGNILNAEDTALVLLEASL